MKVPVLFPKIFDYPFTYKSEISQKLNPGDFVKAPFGSSEVTGVVWPHEQKTEKKFKLKKISKKINVKNLNSSMIKFITWFSKYNLVSLGMSFKMCLLNKDVVEKSFNKEFDRFKIKKGKNKSILWESFNNILSPSINNDSRKQGLPSIKNLYNDEYIEYTNKIYSEDIFLNSNLLDGKKINKDFQFFRKTKDNESIKSLDVFFRLYLMNKGFNVLKEDLNKLTDSNRIKDSYNVLN